MAKALEQELLQYFFQLNDAEKKSVLHMLKTFAKGKEGKASRVSMEEYNQELQEAEAEYERVEHTTQEEFVKQINNKKEVSIHNTSKDEVNREQPKLKKHRPIHYNKSYPGSGSNGREWE